MPSWGRPGDHIRQAGRHCGQGAPVCIPLPKSKGHPLPESRMILREKISGKVELDLHYVLLFHDSGIYPVFLLISHVVLLQTRTFQPKSGMVQGFAADKVERVRSRIGLKVG